MEITANHRRHWLWKPGDVGMMTLRSFSRRHMLLWAVAVFLAAVAVIAFLLSSESSSNHSKWTASLAYVPSAPPTTVTSALIDNHVLDSPALAQITCVPHIFCLAFGSRFPSTKLFSMVPASKYNALLLTNHEWKKISLPTPPTPPSQRIMNVACAGRSSCVATGVAALGKVSWGETFKVAGSSVATVRKVFVPKGFVGYDSACLSVRSCLISGRVFVDSKNGNPPAILSVTLGTSNDKLTQPFGSKAHGGLFGLSCPSPTNCYAVGRLTVTLHRDMSVAVVVEGYGTRWRRMPLPHLEGHASSLFSISCVSVTTCMAVGSILRNGVPTHPLALELVDGSWKTMRMSPAVIDHGELTAVRCFTATDCLAVGDGSTSTSSPSSKGTAASFQGGAWRIVPVPKATVTNMNQLACANLDECFAISGQDIVEFKR